MPETRQQISDSSALFQLGWAIAGCFIVMTLVLFVTSDGQQKEIARAKVQAETLSRDLEAERRWGLTLASPGVRAATFTLTQAAAAGLRGRATVDPGTRRALLVFENVTSPDGSVYELWALRGVTPGSVARLRPDASGRAVLRIQDIGDPSSLTAFVVSVEADAAPPSDSVLTAAPGREPAGPIVMIGSLSR